MEKQKENFKRTSLSQYIVLFLSLLLISGLASCGQEQPVKEEKEVTYLSFNEEEISEQELMIYVNQINEQFKEIAGEEVWEFEDFSSGKSAVEVGKDTLFDNIARTKVLNIKAKELGIVLNETEQKEVAKDAKEYFDNMKNGYVREYRITDENVEKVFRENKISNKVFEYVMRDFEATEEDIIEQLEQDEEYKFLYNIDPIEVMGFVSVMKVSVSNVKVEKDMQVLLSEEERKENEELAKKWVSEYLKLQQIENLQEAIEIYYGNDIYKAVTYESVELDTSDILAYFEKSLSELEVFEVSPVILERNSYNIYVIEEVHFPTAEEMKSYNQTVKEYDEYLREEAENTMKHKAFDVLYEQWQNEADIAINQKNWEELNIVH